VPLAGHGLRPPHLRQRASRPQLKRNPLGGTTNTLSMSKHSLQLLAVCTGVCACVREPPGPQYVGHYLKGLGNGEFQPCGTSETWWVAWDSTVPPETLVVFAQGKLPSQLFARLRGDTTALGNYGPLGRYPRQLLLRRTVELRPARRGDCP